MSSLSSLSEPVQPDVSSLRAELEQVKAERDQARAWLRRIGDVCSGGARGDLEDRLLHIDGDPALRATLDAVNNFVDITDAFVRESAAALIAASERRYHRTLRPKGLQGAFRRAAELINESIGGMKAQHERIESLRVERLELADQFESKIADVVQAVAAAATEAQATASQLAETTADNRDRTNNVAAAAEQAAVNLNVVAESMSEIAAVIARIGDQTNDAGTVAKSAEAQVDTTRAVVGELSDASSTIASVIGLITDIAQQTNLLALNAAIEAARAGEAGKGFAVVANEVKELAKQTREATEQVETRVGSIQGSVKGVSEAIERVDEIMRTIAKTTDSVNRAVQDQQREITVEIHRSLQEASVGARDVSAHVHGIASSAESTEDAARNLGSASEELSQLAASLQRDVDEFLRTLRKD